MLVTVQKINRLNKIYRSGWRLGMELQKTERQKQVEKKAK